MVRLLRSAAAVIGSVCILSSLGITSNSHAASKNRKTTFIIVNPSQPRPYRKPVRDPLSSGATGSLNARRDSSRMNAEVRGARFSRRQGDWEEHHFNEPEMEDRSSDLATALESPWRTETLPISQVEEQMVRLINRERAKRGLRPLTLDRRLSRTGRDHSRDMMRRHYFSHTSPEGDTVMDRVRADGLPYRFVGENLAHAPSHQLAHSLLMGSPGHRANILHREYTRVGIGVVVERGEGLMITEVFAR